MIIVWYSNYNQAVESRKQHVELTGRFTSEQFQGAIADNIRTLENLKARIENTNGSYFEFWKFDARLVIDQETSISFIEWIDSSMVIREVTPPEENTAAVGLDIGTLDYRRTDWLATKTDSATNVTHWLELVQGEYAFLVDVPLFYNGEFHGTITAGMDFQQKFDEILLGGQVFYVEVEDERGTIFYKFGDPSGKEEYAEYLYESRFLIPGRQQTSWKFRIVPNKRFMEERGFFSERLNLFLGLVLCLLLAIALYYILQSLTIQKRHKEANTKLRSLIDSSPVAIYVINIKGEVVDFWNKAAEEMLGWKKEEVMGKFIPHVYGDSKKEFVELINNMKSGKQIKEKDMIRYRKDGSKIHVRLNVGPLVTEAGEKQMLVLLQDMTVQKEIQKKLETSLFEKEVLLKEVHHRVKNNLAIITGLIELQIEDMREPKLQNALKETQNRIFSIAGVHELLYSTTSFTDISVEEYVHKLIQRMVLMFESNGTEVKIRQELDIKNLNINQAIPLGLMLNELITNSYKHAFTDSDKGNILVSIQQEGKEIYVFYKDDGKGFDLKKFNSSNTLGLMIIKTLLEQLDADYEADVDGSFELRFHFRVREKGSHSNL